MSQHQGHAGTKRKKISERFRNDESEDYLKGSKCQNEIKVKGSLLSSSVCGKDAYNELSCGHTFCKNCTSYYETCVSKEYVKCLVCRHGTKIDEIKIPRTDKRKQSRHVSNTTAIQSKFMQEYTTPSQKLQIHSLASGKKKQCSCGSYDVQINLSCGHSYCSPCFFGRHMALAILEEYCCIKCFHCKVEMWYIFDELKSKAESNGERFSCWQTSDAGIQSTDIQCYFKDRKFHIFWNSLNRSSSFTISVWTNIHEKCDRKIAVQREKDGSYTHAFNISTGVYFFKLAVNKGSEIDLYPKWIGPVNENKAKPPILDDEIRTTIVNSNSIDVSWNLAKASEFVKIEEYVVEIRDGLGEWKEYKRVKHPETLCRVTDLVNDTNYYFRVKVFSSVGYGNEECTVEKICIKSEDKGLPSPPVDIQFRYKKYNEGQICWSQSVCEDRRRALSYIVYMEASNSNDWKKVKEVFADQGQKRFSIWCPFYLMKDYTFYTFRIVARNKYGQSEAVKTKYVMKKSRPLPPEALDIQVNDEMTYAIASWRSPVSDGGLLLQKFNIEVRIKSEKQIVMETSVQYNNTNIKIDIRSFQATTFELRITAENKIGKSDTIAKSFRIEKKMELTDKLEKERGTYQTTSGNKEAANDAKCASKKPTGTKNENVEDNSVEVNQLTQNENTVRMATERNTGTIGNVSKPFKKEDRANTAVKENTYSGQMTAESIKETIDNIAKSDKKEPRTKIDSPNTPNEIKVEANKTSVKVSWYLDYLKRFETVETFVIESRIHGDTFWNFVKLVPIIPDKNWQVTDIQDLKENATYYFRVKARNETGDSEWKYSDKVETGSKEEQGKDTQQGKDEIKVKEEKDKNCNGCSKPVKALETRLLCSHEFCEECSIGMFENAFESENGLECVFYWMCTVSGCDNYTEEKHVEFIGGNSLSQTWLEDRRKSWFEEKKNSTEKDTDVYDNELTENYDASMIRGLPNVGLTCYANCIFQILGQTPYFMDHLHVLVREHSLDNEKSICGQLMLLLQSINGLTKDGFKRKVDFDTVARLVDTICSKDQSFIRGEQADSHSFMMALFNAIKEESKKNEDTKGGTTAQNTPINDEEKQKTPIKMSNSLENDKSRNDSEDKCKEEPMTMFEGYLCNEFKYQGCSHEEISEKQMFNSILIPVKENVHHWSLNEGLKMVLTKEEFAIEDLPCDKCEKIKKGFFGTNKTIKQQIFAKLPDNLVFQLGKFRQVYSSLTKMSQRVEYPYTLEMKELTKKERKPCAIKYNLYGVALHIGTLKYGGHYAAYVKQHVTKSNDTGSDQWYYCSDSVIEKISSDKVLNDYRASILFYHRES